MKIKYKKQLNEKNYVKLVVKISEFELHDKITREEISALINIIKDNKEGKGKC